MVQPAGRLADESDVPSPAGNFRYDAHQYWDAGGDAVYESSYALEERATAAAVASR
jgi:hypothetical protein